MMNLHRPIFHVRDQNSGVEDRVEFGDFPSTAMVLRCGYRNAVNVPHQIHIDCNDVRELRFKQQALYQKKGNFRN